MCYRRDAYRDVPKSPGWRLRGGQASRRHPYGSTSLGAWGFPKQNKKKNKKDREVLDGVLEAAELLVRAPAVVERRAVAPVDLRRAPFRMIAL